MQIKLLTVVGARPQFIKAAMLSRAILADGAGDVVEYLIHTGQHYDDNMSRVFFEDMRIPKPYRQFELGGGSHGQMTGRMLEALEREMIELAPDAVVVYGDTNSTLAGALAAAKLHIPVIHIEAGLRSFNRQMPEEVNRVLTDHVSSLLFCPTSGAVRQLAAEGIVRGVMQTGDIMYDAAKAFAPVADSQSDIVARLGLVRGEYLLCTVHRAENTDCADNLRGILQGLRETAEVAPVVLPLHPRTRRKIEEFSLRGLLESLTVIEPVSFIDMIALERQARVIATDSGGVQKEAYYHGVPCITLRNETEWAETVAFGWNVLAGAGASSLRRLVEQAGPGQAIPEYGDGHAAEQMVGHIRDWFRRAE